MPGVPFIFANFNGTHHDIDVFTHEMGHAFQNYQSRDLPGVDYLWPTYESAEIHSMSLEHLAYPQIGLLVGEDAGRAVPADASDPGAGVSALWRLRRSFPA